MAAPPAALARTTGPRQPRVVGTGIGCERDRDDGDGARAPACGPAARPSARRASPRPPCAAAPDRAAPSGGCAGRGLARVAALDSDSVRHADSDSLPVPPALHLGTDGGLDRRSSVGARGCAAGRRRPFQERGGRGRSWCGLERTGQSSPSPSVLLQCYEMARRVDIRVKKTGGNRPGLTTGPGRFRFRPVPNRPKFKI